MLKSVSHSRAFTLIELLTVIAIIGILAAILIPTVAGVRTSANKVASKTFFRHLELALITYKAEYRHYPTQFNTSQTTGTSYINLSQTDNSAQFIRLITGRNPDGSDITDQAVLNLLNKRAVSFITLDNSHFYRDPVSGLVDQNRLADKFNNVNITILIDLDGDGFISPPDSTATFRKELGVIVTGDESENQPSYSTLE